MRVRWTVPARRDLVAAIDFIRADSPRGARVLAERVYKILGLLTAYPQSGREGKLERTREVSVAGTRYLIVYRVSNSEIELLRLLHSAQQWPPD